MPSFPPLHTVSTPVSMPAAVSAKSQQIGKENFAIRGLQFCGFLKRHSGPIEAQISTIKPPPHHAKTASGFSKSANDLLDNGLLAPPPPYRHARPTSSLGSLTSNSDEEATQRRTRRLSKPPPSPTSQDHAHPPSSPLSKSFSTSALRTSPTPPSPPPRRSSPPVTTTTTTTATKEKATKAPFPSLDSSGRPRPPVSGVRTKSPSTLPTKQNGGEVTHTYHYKRVRAPSTADASRRTQEAVLCLEALLDACESGAVEDMRHVIEQVTLARKILIGDDDGIGLAKSIRGGGTENTTGTATSTGSHKAGASTSVTSLATLSNLVA